jgi:hypothetical protein
MRNLGIQLQTLGYVAKTKRNIKNSNAYAPLFGAPSGKVINVKSNASLDDITTSMQQLVNQTLPQTQKFANWLKSKSTSTENLLQNLFTFIYNHFDYKEDEQGFEQLREPARLFKDKIGDCDCYAIFIKSVLTNLGIPSHFKIVALNNNPNFQHVYVIVPKQSGASLNERNNYWVIDPVLDKFNLEPPAITKQQIKGLNGLQLQTLGATTFVVDKSKLLPPVLDNYIIPQGGFLTASTIKFGEAYNPFEQVIEQTFKGSRIENLAKTKLAPRNKAINGLNGASVLDNLNPLDPNNINTLLDAPEVKDYANTLKGSVKLLDRPAAQAAIKKLAHLNKVISENKIDAKASDIVLSPKPVKAFLESPTGIALMGSVGIAATSIGTSVAIAGIGFLLGSNPVGWAATGIGIAVGVVVTALLFLFTNNADETLGNFFDWIQGKGATIIPWDNYEGFKDDKTDINTYGNLIRGWRRSATGSESGTDGMQIPADYFPILLSIYQNAPLEPGKQFIVNPNKAVLHAQFDTAMTKAFNDTAYWKQWGWMKNRAYMVTPLLAEILYRETYDSYKIKMQVFFQSKNVQVNWALIDAEYLVELQNTLFLELLIAKRNQIAYDNSNNPQNNTINPTDPAVNGAIVWIGGQYNGTRAGFQTNQPNLGLKVGDKVLIQINGGTGSAYNGIRTIHSLGTDDGLYTKNMFVLDMPMIAGAQQSTGVFTFQAPFESGDAGGGGGLFKVGALALGIKLLSALV